MGPHGQYRSHLVSINNYFIVKRIYYVTIATVQSLLSTSSDNEGILMSYCIAYTANYH